ncbi:CXXC-rich protein [Entamoeba marina]
MALAFSCFCLFSLAYAASIVDVDCGIPNCYSCNNQDGFINCTQCIDDYYMVDNDCIHYKDIVPNCNKFTDGVCTSCLSGYHITQNTCVRNDANCLLYFESNCRYCVNGYKVEEGNCVACEEKGCSTCSETTSYCEECFESYYLNNGKCVQPVNHCSSYVEGKPVCSECQEGYYLLWSECEPILISNCLRVSINDNTNCTSCYGNMVPSESGRECIYSSTISNCIKYSNVNECIECHTGYFLTSNGLCQECDNLCSICDSNECTECEVGYYLDLNKNCTKCSYDQMNNCEEETSLHACRTCNSDCIFDDEMETCDDGYCLVYQENSDFCEICEEGFVLSTTGKICIESEDGCKVYSGEDSETDKDSTQSSCSEYTSCLEFNDADDCVKCIPTSYGLLFEHVGEDGECDQNMDDSTILPTILYCFMIILAII